MIAQDLPLIDLHRHIEGTIGLETILDLAHQFNVPLPADSVEGLKPFVQITQRQPGVMAFIEKFTIPMQVLVNMETCRRVSYEAVLGAHQEGIDYLELRFSPWFMAEAHQLSPQGVVEAVLDGVQAASQESGLSVNLLGILSRTYGLETAAKELNSILPYADQITGLDLAGDEANFPAALFEKLFDKARDAGLKITVHAGESAGPESIRQAVQVLGASRIGHGLAAASDPSLMDLLFQHQIGIEANLTSNVQTSSVKDYASHPVKLFLEQGLLVSIHSDDPAISGITLPYEYNVAAPQTGCSEKQIRQLQLNALESAFLSPREKQKLARSVSDPNNKRID
jgi:adenosine deaminase